LSNDSFNFRIWIMAAVVAMLSATAGVTLWKMTQMRQNPVFSSLIVLPEPRIIDDFALQDASGQLFSLEQLRGNWTLMFFGFTHCPDVCPTALYELQNLKSLLEKEADSDLDIPRIVFVSVDPERDSAEKLSQYLSHFDPGFTGVTAAHEQLQPFTRQVGIAYHIEDHEAGATSYAVDHSSGILLMNPAGQLHGVFPTPHRSELMANDLLIVLETS
jgi:protein SCO1/2